MKKIAVYLVVLFCLVSCDKSAELPGKLSIIDLERSNLNVDASKSSVTIGVGVSKSTWYILRSQTIANGECSILNNTTYKYSDDKMQDVILYRDTLEGDWFKILKNKDGNLQVDIAKNEYPNERTLIIDIGGFLCMTESLVITQFNKK